MKQKKKYHLKQTPLKRGKRTINSVSTKRKKESKIYSIKRRLFLSGHTTCEIKSPNCTVLATIIHHKKGREGSLFLDEEYWAASCWNCNGYVEVHDKWARDAGHKLSKHTMNHFPEKPEVNQLLINSLIQAGFKHKENGYSKHCYVLELGSGEQKDCHECQFPKIAFDIMPVYKQYGFMYWPGDGSTIYTRLQNPAEAKEWARQILSFESHH